MRSTKSLHQAISTFHPPGNVNQPGQFLAHSFKRVGFEVNITKTRGEAGSTSSLGARSDSTADKPGMSVVSGAIVGELIGELQAMINDPLVEVIEAPAT